MCYKIVRLICKFTVDDREDEQEGVQPLPIIDICSSLG